MTDGPLNATDTATVVVTNAATGVHLGDGKGKFISKKKSSKAVKSATGKAKLTFTAGTKGDAVRQRLVQVQEGQGRVQRHDRDRGLGLGQDADHDA